MKIRWTLFRRICSWFLLLVSLGYITYFLTTHQEGIRLMLGIDVPMITGLLLIHLAYLVVYSYRLQIVLGKSSNLDIRFWPWFKIYTIGQFLNSMIPQLGNIYRAVRLKEDHQVTYTRYVSAYFSFMWMGICVNLVIALVVIVALDPELRIGPVRASQLVLSLAVLFGAVPVLLNTILSNWRTEIGGLVWIHEKSAEILRVSVQGLEDRTYLARFFLVGLILLFLACVALYLCFLALATPVAPEALILFYVLLQVGTYVNLTPGNLGVQELAFGVLAEGLGIGMAEGILASGLMRITGYTVLFAVAIALGGWGVLRQQRQQAEACD